MIARWTTVGWPHKMVQMIEQVALQWEEDEERFRKLQLSDLAAFNDRVDALTVCRFSFQFFQWLKWSREAGGLTRRSQVGANPIPI